MIRMVPAEAPVAMPATVALEGEGLSLVIGVEFVAVDVAVVLAVTGSAVGAVTLVDDV